MELAKLVSLYGNVKELLLPSGATAIIREQNGDDDALLSNVALNKAFDSLNTFIASITVHLSCSADPSKPPTLSDILDRPLNDKYFILIASRIFSLGEELTFNYTWSQERGPIVYSENLSNYLWDYTKPIPQRGEPGYFDQRIGKIEIPGDYHFISLPSGKDVRFKLMDSHGEKYLLNLPNTERDINQGLLARELSLKVEGEYVRVSSFKSFTSREMAILRNHIEKADPIFEGLTTLVNPDNDSEVEEISLIQIKDFFFPREI